MNRELLILRHAKSAWDTRAASDFERPLSGRGLRAAPRVGRFLHQQGLIPDYVVSSPAERAKQTVTLVCEELSFDPLRIHWDKNIYGGWPASLIKVLRECPSNAGRVLIAGHNPGMESLVEGLCEHRVVIPGDGKLIPTAAVAHLEISLPWDELDSGCAQLLSITRARSLSD